MTHLENAVRAYVADAKIKIKSFEDCLDRNGHIIRQEERLREIQRLDRSELKTLYRELMLDHDNTARTKAGVGPSQVSDEERAMLNEAFDPSIRTRRARKRAKENTSLNDVPSMVIAPWANPKPADEEDDETPTRGPQRTSRRRAA